VEPRESSNRGELQVGEVVDVVRVVLLEILAPETLAKHAVWLAPKLAMQLESPN